MSTPYRPLPPISTGPNPCWRWMCHRGEGYGGFCFLPPTLWMLLRSGKVLLDQSFNTFIGYETEQEALIDLLQAFESLTVEEQAGLDAGLLQNVVPTPVTEVCCVRSE